MTTEDSNKINLTFLIESILINSASSLKRTLPLPRSLSSVAVVAVAVYKVSLSLIDVSVAE